MSRSYKKYTNCRMSLWGHSMKKGKQYSNRKIRRKIKDCLIDVGNGKDYQRFGLDSWDLWEFNFYETKQDAIDNWERDQKDLANGIKTWRALRGWTLKDQLNDWVKFYKRK